ncbi:MAG: substrate-binding domain-containing protein [Spirochaetota bacterium]
MDKQHTTVNRHRPTIGYLFEHSNEGYEYNCWAGVASAAEKLDINLLCFAGGALNSKSLYTRERNRIFQHVNAGNVDAIIISSGPLCHFVEPDELYEFIQTYKPVPAVSIGITFPGIPSLTVNNEKGMYDSVVHLIRHHNRSRIAFIRGPETNEEAEIRYVAYKRALEDCGLSLDRSLVYQGNFERDSGMSAVIELLDHRNTSFDAVVGANDYMALYAMKELRRRGIRVPEEVSVSGFDDLEEALSDETPLSTVKQPLFELGYKAVETVLDMINGKDVEEVIGFDTSLVIRKSCGCIIPFSISDEYESQPEEKTDSIEATTTAIAKVYPYETELLSRRLQDDNWLSLLIEGLAAYIAQDDVSEVSSKTGFFSLLERFVQKSLELGADIVYWEKIVIYAYRKITTHGSNAGERDRLSDHLSAILVFLGNLSQEYQTYIGIQEREIFNLLQRIHEELVFSYKKERVKKIFSIEFPNIDINECYIYEYHDIKNIDTARLHISYGQDGVSDRHYTSCDIVPGGIQNREKPAKLMIIPLQIMGESFGFLVIEIGIINGTVYETLARQISSSIKADRMLHQLHDYSTSLERKVEERTAELKSTQQKLVDAAHQAGMAEIAVGIMHNMGNLLNSVNISTQQIARMLSHSRTKTLLQANEMLLERIGYLDEFLANETRGRALAEYLGKVGPLIGSEQEQLAKETGHLQDKIDVLMKTIEMHQQYAKGTAVTEPVYLINITEEALTLQMGSHNRHHVTLEKNYPDRDIVIYGQKSKLLHTIINLLKNAVESLKNVDEDGRKIVISVDTTADGRPQLSVKDTGIGIEKKNLDRIFNYGFTTKADGHGFGLHTCANFMTEMDAEISAHSDGPDKGAHFTIVFNSYENGKEHS